MDLVRDKVLGQLASKDKLWDECYLEQRNYLMQMSTRLAKDRKSGSVLVLGPRGAGKTTLVQSCLATKAFERTVQRVFLNGILQPNAAAALKAMTEQLEGSVLVEDEDGENEIAVANVVKDLLKTGHKPLAIVIEEFDRFAMDRTPEKQTLLYSLLDATHNPLRPLLVIGISTRLDVLDSLEKRVRSRVAQRPLLLMNDWEFDQYVKCAQFLLTWEETKETRDEKAWNKSVGAVLSSRDVKNCLELLYKKDRSLLRLRRYLTLVVSMTDKENVQLSKDQFRKAYELSVSDSWKVVLPSLSTLELTIVLVAIKCSDIYHGVDDLNFELIYKEYCEGIHQQQRVVADVASYPKVVMLQAFDKLCDIGVFASTKPIRSQTNNLRQFQSVKLQINAHTIRTHVKKGAYADTVRAWIL